MSGQEVTFLLPRLDKSIRNKINNNIEVLSDHEAFHRVRSDFFESAIACDGFPSNRDGIFVCSLKIESAPNYVEVGLGFTSMATFDSSKNGCPSDNGMSGVAFTSHAGCLVGGNGDNPSHWKENYLPTAISRKAKEIVAIFTISQNGKKKFVQFVVDGNEGKSVQCRDDTFENGGNQIFPVVSMHFARDKITFIPFHQVQSNSPRIGALDIEFEKQQRCKNNPPPPPPPPPPQTAPSVSNAMNDLAISRLRQRIDEEQKKQISVLEEQLKHARLQMDEFRKDFLKQLDLKTKGNDDSRRDFLKQLETKDKQISSQLSQLELERAEHQKTRNLLQKQKEEMKDMEIYYLKRESGQRRQREEETATMKFKVKEEPKDDDDDEDEAKNKSNKCDNKKQPEKPSQAKSKGKK
jgi:hypothetical protein